MSDYDKPNLPMAIFGIVGLICFGFGLAYRNKFLSGTGSLLLGLMILFKVIKVLKAGSIVFGPYEESSPTYRRCCRTEDPGGFWLGTVVLAIFGVVFCVVGAVQLLGA